MDALRPAVALLRFARRLLPEVALALELGQLDHLAKRLGTFSQNNGYIVCKSLQKNLFSAGIRMDGGHDNVISNQLLVSSVTAAWRRLLRTTATRRSRCGA